MLFFEFQRGVDPKPPPSWVHHCLYSLTMQAMGQADEALQNIIDLVKNVNKCLILSAYFSAFALFINVGCITYVNIMHYFSVLEF